MDEWGGHLAADLGDVVSFDEATKPGERRILFTGPRRYAVVNHCFDLHKVSGTFDSGQGNPASKELFFTKCHHTKRYSWSQLTMLMSM